MGALVADIAAAFVLLVAGGGARAVAQPVWRRFVHWWHTEGNEPAEFKFMERLVKWMAAEREAYGVVDISAAKTEDEAMDALARLTKQMEKQYTGTKNAGKVPILGNCAGFSEREEYREVLLAQQAKVAKAAEDMRKAEEELIRARLEEGE